MRTYIFVDAENHFIRSTAAAEDIIGSPKAAEALSKAELSQAARGTFPERIDGKRFGWNPGLQLFWDCHTLSKAAVLTSFGADISRAVYSCSCTGDDDKAHEMRVQLRKYGFEPIVIRESKNRNAQRSASLKQHGLIEKPKGCDIAIATRMVADAAADLYDCCILFTSDADFIPAIKAVRAMGKIVWVFGYESALPVRSPYLYIPDQFVDLGAHLDQVWRNSQRQIEESLNELLRTSS